MRHTRIPKNFRESDYVSPIEFARFQSSESRGFRVQSQREQPPRENQYSCRGRLGDSRHASHSAH